MVRLRLQRHGRKRLPYYHIVVADVRKPRDGRIIETLGKFNPMTDDNARITLDTERVVHWLKTGAQPSDTVRSILKNEGIFYRMHLERWGKTSEEIDAAISAWKTDKSGAEQKTLSRAEKMKAQLKAEEEAVKKAEAEAAKAAEEAAKKAEEDAKAAEKAASAEAEAPAEVVAEETEAVAEAEETKAEESAAEGEEETK